MLLVARVESLYTDRCVIPINYGYVTYHFGNLLRISSKCFWDGPDFSDQVYKN